LEIRAKISLAVEQFKANASVVGGLWKGLTVDAQKHTQNVDKFINKSLNNRIQASRAGNAHDMAKLSEFERAAVASNRRIAKETMRAQAGAINNSAGYDAWIKKNLVKTPAQRVERAPLQVTDVTARKNAEREYTKWWASELNKRDQMNFWNSAKVQKQLTRNDQKMWRDNLRERSRAEMKEAFASFTYRQKYNAIYAAGVTKRAAGQFASQFSGSSLNAGREAKLAADALHKAHLNSEEFNKSLSRTRYALYDIGSKLLGFGTAIAAGLGQAIQQAAAFESAFTRVERTTGATGSELAGLRKSLIDLSTTMPVSFEQITAVATLGAQMGIASDSIDSFTQTVTKFSAITGVAVEEVAMSLGRLGQLLDVPASKFENLSAAITFVGVNAVATDREILVMSESISAAANQAGFAADEVIGLSGALASLKVRPEEARGVIVRLFREIDSSVSEGGTRLDDFAKTLNMTSEETAKLWGSDPSKFFTSFLTAAKAGGNLNEVITALGITNSRELNVIQRLANNTDVLATTMANAHEQYLLGTYASDAYGKVQDDLASKMTIFQSVLQELQASFGDAFMGPMKAFFDFIISVGKGLAAMPGPMKMLLGILAAMASGFLIFKGAMLLAVGGMLAMRLAMQTMGFSSVKSMASLSTLRTVMGSTGAMGAKAAVGIRILSFGLINQQRAALMAAAGTRILGNAMVWLQRAFLPLMIISTVVAAVASFIPAGDDAANSANKLGDAMIEAGGGAEELMKAIALDTQAMKDGEGYIGKMVVQFDKAAVAQEKLNIKTLAGAEMANATVEGLKNAELGQGELTDAKEIDTEATEKYNETIATTNDLLGKQEFALGANTAAFVANALAKYGENSDQNLYQQIAEDPEGMADMKKLGFNIADMIAAGMSEGTSATEYLQGFQDELGGLNTYLSDLGVAYGIAAGSHDFSEDVRSYGERAGWSAEKIDLMAKAVGKSGNMLEEVPDYFFEAAESIDAMKVSAEQLEASKGIQKQVLMDQGYSAEAAGDMVEGLSEQLKKYITAASAIPSSNAANISSFATFAKGIKETDGDLSMFTENGRTNMDNFRNFMTSSLEAAEKAGTGFAGGIDRIASGLSVLNSQGVDTSAAFSEFQTYMSTASTADGFTTLSSKIKEAGDPANLIGLIAAMKVTKDVTQEEVDAANALSLALQGSGYAASFLATYMSENTKKTTTAAKEMKTLSQYASEVGNLMKTSIDIKFSKTNGIIGLKNTMADINKNLKDAKANLRELNSSIEEKQTKKQQLGVDLALAEQFGDVAGANRIRGEMAALDAEIAQNQEDIAYNTGIATGSLDLNTQAGRDNVQTIQQLTTANAEYIQGLIDSGAPQSTVLTAIKNSKTAFENQLTAMGLSKTEIGKYSSAFSGFATIVKKAPKNVTIKANTNPAERALTDFIKLANSSKASVTLDVKPPTKEDRLKALKTEQTRLNTELKGYSNPANLTGTALGQYKIIKGQKDSVDALIKSGNYENGGLIQGFGGSRQDNIVIGASQNEFMMSAQSVNKYGVGFMNALNQQRVSVSGFGGGGFGGGNGSNQVVYLSARDRELLQAAANRPVILKTTNRTIAQSANDGNKELARRGSN
jgi:TP901 family phage tail tape measure protein